MSLGVQSLAESMTAYGGIGIGNHDYQSYVRHG